MEETITMKPQNLEFPVQMLDELRKLGMKVEVSRGQIVLRDDFFVTKAGEPITPEGARVLVKMDRKLINFKIKLICRWCDGEFEEL